MFFSVKQVFNAVHVVSLSCFVCAEEDFLNATDEGADGNSAQGRDLITASSSSRWAKRCCVFLSVQICAPPSPTQLGQQITPTTINAYGTARLTRLTSWTSREETSSTSSARSARNICGKNKKQKKQPLFQSLYIFPVVALCPHPFKKAQIVTRLISNIYKVNHSRLHPNLQ